MESNSDLSIDNHKNNILNTNQLSLELERQISLLKNISQTIDPYSPLSNQMITALAEVQITDISNPFTLTNQILFKLENTIEELAQLEKN